MRIQSRRTIDRWMTRIVIVRSKTVECIELIVRVIWKLAVSIRIGYVRIYMSRMRSWH